MTQHHGARIMGISSSRGSACGGTHWIKTAWSFRAPGETSRDVASQNRGGFTMNNQDWLVVWLPFFIFPYIGNSHPNWLIFFRGGWKHQPDEQPGVEPWRTEHGMKMAWKWNGSVRKKYAKPNKKAKFTGRVVIDVFLFVRHPNIDVLFPLVD